MRKALSKNCPPARNLTKLKCGVREKSTKKNRTPARLFILFFFRHDKNFFAYAKKILILPKKSFSCVRKRSNIFFIWAVHFCGQLRSHKNIPPHIKKCRIFCLWESCGKVVEKSYRIFPQLSHSFPTGGLAFGFFSLIFPAPRILILSNCGRAGNFLIGLISNYGIKSPSFSVRALKACDLQKISFSLVI